MVPDGYRKGSLVHRLVEAREAFAGRDSFELGRYQVSEEEQLSVSTMYCTVCTLFWVQ